MIPIEGPSKRAQSRSSSYSPRDRERHDSGRGSLHESGKFLFCFVYMTCIPKVIHCSFAFNVDKFLTVYFVWVFFAQKEARKKKDANIWATD